ncbi:MAG TPA: lectin [Lysobacter sp.]
MIGFSGFGPAKFGASDEQVRMAWGADLGDARPEQPGGCYYLLPQPRTAKGYRIGFMIEQDRFARIDVDALDIEAPGGGKVGMSAQDIDRIYAGRVTRQPHKYVEGGQYLRVADAGGGSGVLLFETDGAGRVSSWRVGVSPQVDYVEGCS